MWSTYDRWKTRSPDDERWCDSFEGPEDECAHEDFETNSEGRRSCCCCDHSWWPTTAEIETEQHLQREYDKWQRQEARREFWRKVTYPIRWPIYRLLEKIWPRKSCSVLLDDEIPF